MMDKNNERKFFTKKKAVPMVDIPKDEYLHLNERKFLTGIIPPPIMDVTKKKAVPMVKITKKEYDHLKDRDLLCSMLEGYGVDNWQGWDDAYQGYLAEKEKGGE